MLQRVVECRFPEYVRQKLSCIRVPVCCSVFQYVLLQCIVLQCAAVCCSVLQCVAVCCSVLQCVVLQRKGCDSRRSRGYNDTMYANPTGRLQCVCVCVCERESVREKELLADCGAYVRVQRHHFFFFCNPSRLWCVHVCVYLCVCVCVCDCVRDRASGRMWCVCVCVAPCMQIILVDCGVHVCVCICVCV